jgi:Chlorophyll A-B binding protein
MLAVLGHIITTAGVRLPGDIDYSGTKFADIPTGLAALDKISTAGLAQIVAFIGFLELFVMKDVTGDGEFVGDFRNGAIDFGWDSLSPEGAFSIEKYEFLFSTFCAHFLTIPWSRARAKEGY